MNRLLNITLCLLCFALAVPSASASVPAEKVRLALFPFAAKNVTSEEIAIVRREIRKLLERSQQYDLMSDGTFLSLASDLGLTNLDECQLPSCLAVIGSRLGVQQVLQGSLERLDNSTTLKVMLVNVAEGKILLARTIVFSHPIAQLNAEALKPLAQDFDALAVEPERSIRWYYVVGAVLVAGATIYLVSKGVADKKDREYENEPPPPPPPGGN
jgi:hypothetical protein